jgi:hypothetical protein
MIPFQRVVMVYLRTKSACTDPIGLLPFCARRSPQGGFLAIGQWPPEFFLELGLPSLKLWEIGCRVCGGGIRAS